MAARKKSRDITLEWLLTSPEAFGMTTASDVQRAFCRLADGLPLGALANSPAVRRALGDVGPEGLPKPLELYLISGSRVGKSRTAAALGLRAVLTVDVSMLGPGDEPRIPILSLDKDKAAAVHSHLLETMKQRPALRGLIAREGENDLGSPAVWIKHPSGRLVQVCVAAGKRAGGAVVSYFLAGIIFDEFPRMLGEGDAVVNFDDARKNSLGRLLPGAQLVGIGSPWAPFGPAYEMVQKHWRKPTADLVIVKAPGRDVNPAWWTPERIAKLPADVLRTEEEAEFRDPESSLLNSVQLLASTRDLPLVLPPEDGFEYAAAIDPGTRGNSWTLIVVVRRRAENGWPARKAVALARQWTGSKVLPLSPKQVFLEIATILRPYRCDALDTDQWGYDPNRDLARDAGLTLREVHWQGAELVEQFDRLANDLADRRVELSPDEDVRADLLRVKKKTEAQGISIHLPKTPDGRHCDYAPALVRALARHLPEPPQIEDERTRFARERQEMLQKLARDRGKGGESYASRFDRGRPGLRGRLVAACYQIAAYLIPLLIK
jgi:hypothetical protein